jgi:nucleoside-diphosphate-sugar epimerase
VEVMIGNLLSVADITRALDDVDTIYHLAGAMRGAPATIFLDSVVASRRLLDAIESHSVKRFVLISSLSVYGLADVPVRQLVDESTALEPHPENRDPYSYAKLRQELMVSEHATRIGLELIILRPGTLYGRRGRAFSPRVGLTVAGWLLHFGGHNLLPLSHVSNCAEAVVLAGTDKFAAGAYNVLDDDLPTAAEYIKAYKREVGNIHSIRCPFFATMLSSKLAARWHTSSGGQVPHSLTPYGVASLWRGHRFDNSKLRSAGWTQVMSTREALADAFDDLRRRRDEVSGRRAGTSCREGSDRPYDSRMTAAQAFPFERAIADRRDGMCTLGAR